jgi:hypothetical protein
MLPSATDWLTTGKIQARWSGFSPNQEQGPPFLVRTNDVLLYFQQT